MATSTTTSKETTPTEEKPTVVSADDIKKVMEDPRFSLPAATIKTAEDAYYAYLREEIDEKELRAVVASFGGSPFYALKGNLERPDNAYQRSVPEDLYDDPSLKVTPLDERLMAAQAKQEEAHAATDAAAEETTN